MMIVMKSLCILVLAAVAGSAAQPQAAVVAPVATSLQGVHTVYLFPMRNGFDQYLAGDLTERHVFQVVTDPKAADAVFTDSMGPGFEEVFEQRVLDVKPKSKDSEPHPAMRGGRGTLFLVSKSKQVIWSAYDPPKDTSPKQLRNAAKRSVTRLAKDLTPQPGS
jgi:hypothetical protein